MILDDATVLITGGTGSLGQTLVRRLLRGELGTPKKMIVFSRCEAKQYAMKSTWKHAHKATDDIYYANFEELLEFRIGDVRDYASIQAAVSDSEVVINAAAMKQVPTCEYFPAQAVATNVTGADNIVRAVRGAPNVHTVMCVSTDKACKPINVMGMTKALQERIFIEANVHQDHCRFIGIRYGNVLASRGSVVPLFEHQIAHGGPVTLTTPEMTRFLLSLDRAADAVFAALLDARRGELYVPRLPSARVTDIAKHLIGGKKIEMVFTGIRPGEKVHEILVSEEEAFRTEQRGDYYVIHSLLPEITPSRPERTLVEEYSSRTAVVEGSALTDLLAQADFIDPAMAGSSSLTG
jgi:FlaA1/EpsC-like NDP-sugar epimerase